LTEGTLSIFFIVLNREHYGESAKVRFIVVMGDPANIPDLSPVLPIKRIQQECERRNTHRRSISCSHLSRAPQSAQCAPAARSRSAFRVDEPTLRKRTIPKPAYKFLCGCRRRNFATLLNRFARSQRELRVIRQTNPPAFRNASRRIAQRTTHKASQYSVSFIHRIPRSL